MITRLFLLTRSELVALSIFISYFVLILSLFVLIVHSLWRKGNSQLQQRTPVWLFSCLAVASFGFTWYYMIGYLLWSFRAFEATHYSGNSQHALDGLQRLVGWLTNSDLFEEAWAIVCDGPMNWWWSEKLCLFTVGYWTIFLSTEGRSRSIPHLWAYMLLGQVVAISVAANLFYVALSLSLVSPAKNISLRRTAASPPWALWLSVVASLTTVVYSPYTSKASFLPNLLIMHAFIVLPLIFPSNVDGQLFKTSTLYTTVTLLSVTLHAWTTAKTFLALPDDARSLSGFGQSALQTFFSHPAQSSISWDVVWTFVSLVAWLVFSPRGVPTHPVNSKAAGLKKE